MSFTVGSAESNYSSSENKDFTLSSRTGRKREREASELDVKETSQKKIRKSLIEDDDFLEKEAQVFRRSIFTSPCASQPSRSYKPASSSYASDFQSYINLGSPYRGSGSPYQDLTSEKTEVISDGEPTIEISTTPPPSSPVVHTSPVIFATSPNFSSPIFARPAGNANQKKLCPPPTPRRAWVPTQEKRLFAGYEILAIEERQDEICFKNALKYKSSLSEIFQHDPRILGVALLPERLDAFLGQGEFVNAYSIRFKADAEAQESVQVVKVHHLTRHIFKPSQLIDCLLSEIEQYVFLKGNKFPVADFYNFDEFLAKADPQTFYEKEQSTKKLKDHLKANFLHPFYRVEYVPYSIANTKEEFESRYEGEIASSQGNLEVLSRLLEKQNDPLCQIKKMFEFAWKEDVCLDLCLGNLRIRKGGEVVLSDLYYDRTEEFSDHVMNCLRTFVLDLHSPLLDYLISSLPEEGKQLLANERRTRALLT